MEKEIVVSKFFVVVLSRVAQAPKNRWFQSLESFLLLARDGCNYFFGAVAHGWVDIKFPLTFATALFVIDIDGVTDFVNSVAHIVAPILDYGIGTS